MRTMKIEVPDATFSALKKDPDEFVREMRIEAATQWYAREKISQARAAEVAGLSRAEFIDELAQRKIPVDQVSEKELMEEIQVD